METIIFYTGLVFFSIIVGLLGIFYRNLLKMPGMVFNPIYRVFEKMVSKGGILKFIAYPLGYCIYCSTTWIGIIGYGIIYRTISFDILVPIAISHYIVMYYCVHYANLPEFNPKKERRNSEIFEKIKYMNDEEFDEFMLNLKS
jgi:hypothetical protein